MLHKGCVYVENYIGDTGPVGTWRLGRAGRGLLIPAWNNKMIVFSAKLIDHIPRWAICLLKAIQALGRWTGEPRAVVTTRPSQPAEALGVWGPSQGWEES